MCKKLLILTWLFCGAVIVPAWSQTKDIQQQIQRGISLYNYGHCIEARTELLAARAQLSHVTDSHAIERVDYYLALCDSELKMTDSEGRLRRFLSEYQGSTFTNEVQFKVATLACMGDDQQLSEAELAKVNYKRLSPQQREQYDLRMGYLAFMRDDYDTAESYLSRITSKGEYAAHATYYKSYMAYARGEWDLAREGFSSLLDNAQYRDLMPFYVMQIDFKQGKYRDVVASGDALIAQTTPEQALQINRMMAESWFQLAEYGKAVDYMNRYRSAGGEMGRVENYVMGYSLHRQAFYGDATPFLREACGADDMLTQNASYHLADCYLRDGDKTNAMYSFAMASSAEYDPSIAEDALFNYGKLQYDLGGGRFNEAINVLSRYIETYPKSERNADARSLLIAAYYNSKNYNEAYQAIKSLPNPDNEAMLALQKIAYFNGLEAYTAGELDTAEKAFRESMNAGSNAKYSALASFWLGEVAYARGNSREALQRYKNFLGRAPKSSNEYAMAHYNSGYCYFNGGEDMSSAARSFDTFLSLYGVKDSYYADALNRRGDIHYSMREFDKAIGCYDKSIALGGLEGYYAQYQRAITQGVQNKRAEKILSLRKIVQTNKGDYVDDAVYELGRTYIADEQYSNGVKTLESFVEQYPSSPHYAQALSDLGLAYMNLGQTQKALEYYDMVVKAAPQSAHSKSALQGIREIYVDSGNADAYFDYAQKVGLDGDVNHMTRDSLSYAAAQKLYLSDKTEEAANGFKNYLNNYANGHYRNDALFFLSDCYIRNGNESDAIVTLTELSNQGQTQYTERVLEKLSSMSYKLERWETAAKAYRQLYDVTADVAVKKSSASGYVASTLKYASDDEIVAMADDVEKFNTITEIARRKARYAKAQVLLKRGDEASAMAVFKVLSSEVKSAEGAESRYLMIEQEYKSKQYDKAEKMVYEFSDSNTPQNYWLAKAFILLGDIYLDRGDSFQARATYQSVVDGYSPADDGIVELAKSKISKMN